MTPSEKMLAKLAEWRPAAGARSSLTMVDDDTGWTTTLTADRNDELGCLLWDVSWSLHAAPAGEAPDLKDWAQRLADRITGLLEPLKVLEVDAARNEAILRSARVTQRGQSLLYYEAVLQGTGNVTLRRYQASHDNGNRQQTAFALTHEAVARVVDDLTAA